MAERTLLLRVIADDRDLQRSMLKDQAAVEKFGKGTTVSLERVGSAFSKTQKLLAGGFVAGFAVAGIKSAVSSASDLHEQLTKADQVFKQSSDTVVAWSKTTADSFGISQRAALTAAGTFGNLIETMGLAPDAAAGMSRKLVELAADLASFNNANPQDVLDALKSGLVGEAEPLRRFGVLLSEARVQQEAMAETGKTTAKSLTDGEKAIARYNLILKDTSPAQGDFARTSDGAANASRRLSANIEDLKTNLGSGLVPALAKVTGALADLTSAMRTTSITADQLTSDKGLRNKFADAFGAKALFDVLNKITSEGLKTRPDEGSANLAGAAAGKQVSAVAQAIIDGLKNANAAARKRIQGALKDTRAALAITGLVDNLSLGVDKAGLTKDLSDDLAALLALKAGLEKQIKAGVDVKSAQSRLVSVMGQIQDVQEQMRSDRFGGILAGLELGVDKAGLTKRLDDDLAALLALKTGLENQIKAGVDVKSAQTELVSVMGQIASKQADVRQAAADALQAKQFRALGLSSTGEDIVPGIENLSKRLNAALSKISSGELDVSSKIASRLKAAKALIRKEGKNLTEETRKQINEWLKALSGDGSKTKTGPLTKTGSFNVDKILAGLGLSRELEKELRARLSGFNSSGVALAGKPVPAFRTGAGVAPIVVTNVNTVTLDGEVVGRTVTRSQQKAGRRNPRQKRGPNTRSGV